MKNERHSGAATNGLVTVVLAGQRLALPMARVDQVFALGQMSVVPLAPPSVAGLMNLRGRIVTALDMRIVLGLPPRADGEACIALGVEKSGELYGLIVDQAGEAAWSVSGLEPPPANLDARWSRFCAGVVQLDAGLMMLLDVDKVLDLSRHDVAA